MLTNNALLSQNYKLPFCTSGMIERDLKQIRKINTLFRKLEKTDKETYAHEIINILKTLNNIMYVERVLGIFYRSIEPKYHATLEQIIFEVIGVKFTYEEENADI
jgi:hypothetical protein